MFEPGKLLVAQVLPSNQTVGEANAIMIQMQVKNQLEQKNSPFIKVKIPDSLDLQGSCKVKAYSNALKSDARCTVDLSERAIVIENVSSTSLSSSTGTLIFHILEAVRNPQTKTEHIGNFTIETYLHSRDLVDVATVPDAFAIESGDLYAVKMELTPSVSSAPNPRVSFSFQNQHPLVSGSQIVLFIPSDEVSLHKAGPISCTGKSINSSSCKVADEVKDRNYVLTAETDENLPAFAKVSINITNLLKEAPRFKGQLSKPIVAQTRISGRVVDEYSQLYLTVDEVLPMSKGHLGLTAGTNLAHTSLVVDIELKVEP